MSKTYFDILDIAALGNVLRFCMHRPGMADWTDWENRSLLSQLCHPHHPLTSAAQEIVTKLVLGYFNVPEQARLLHVFGGQCSALSIGNGESDLLQQAWRNCRGLKTLKLFVRGNFPFRSLLSVPVCLEELELEQGPGPVPVSNDTMDAVAEYGAGLKSLSVSFIDLRNGKAISRMLEVTGKTLISLCIHRVKNSTPAGVPAGNWFGITSIVDLCPLVTDLRVDRLSPGRGILEHQVELLCLYGEQLKKTSSIREGVPEEFLHRIAESCPNAAIHGERILSDATNILGILGPQIEVLDIRRAEIEPNARMSLSTKCCNVKDLSIRLHVAEAFFSKPNPQLERLCLRDNEDEHQYEAIARIAENSGGLQILSLEGSRLSFKALEKLASSNKYLEKVFAYLICPDPENYGDFFSAYMIDLIDAFLPCLFLKKIHLKYVRDISEDGTLANASTLGKMTAVADKCLLLRSRNVCVRIDDIDYLS